MRFHIRKARYAVLALAVLSTIAASACGFARSRTERFDVREERIYFVTDRLPDGVTFGRQRDTLRYGIATVRVYERAGTWGDSGWSTKPAQKIELVETRVVPREAFYDSVRQSVAQSRYKQAFTYVHGYNNAFDVAVRRAAEIKRGMDDRVVAIAYSWPAQGRVQLYVADLDHARWTVPDLRRYLEEVSEVVAPENMVLVAHSMGSQVLSNALDSSYAPRRLAGRALRAIVLFAPDIDPELLARDHVPSLRRVTRRLTLYETRHDRVLWLASFIRGGIPRSGTRALPADSLEIMDASLVKGRSFLGHGDQLVGTTLVDVYLTIWTGFAAKCRQFLGTADSTGEMVGGIARTRWVLRPTFQLTQGDAPIPSGCEGGTF